MSIVNEAPRGGLIETINDRQCVLLLRNGEIERFEDKHRGIFDVWAGFFEAGKKPTSTEVRDLIALGLVGGGMKTWEADKIVDGATPADLLRFYQIAQACLGSAFLPQIAEQVDKKKDDLETKTSQETKES